MPAKFKEELGCTYFISKGDSGCLYVLSKQAFEQLTEKFRSINFSDNESKKFQRAFFSSADSVEGSSASFYSGDISVSASVDIIYAIE